MLVINKEAVRELMSMRDCILVMEKVFHDLGKRGIIQPVRTAIPLEQENVFGIMPAYLKTEETVGAKLITVFDNNHASALPSHQGTVLLFDSSNGSFKAMIDGTNITAIRTAAVSAVATNLLSKKDSAALSILGTGTQARTHLEAMLFVRPITQIKVWGQNKERLKKFQSEMSEKLDIEIQIYDTIEETVYNSDIICTVTSSKTPILQKEWVKQGAHINAVGACKAKDRELDSNLVKSSVLYVDKMESALNEAGDYLIPLQEGVIDEHHICGELSELVMKGYERSEMEQTTIFKSLGLACEDLAAANFIYQKAVRLHKGTTINF
ncbi:ornithine cyclodeaminase family protein [Bacillus sp. 165]|uniref:ornithine cyclodeaminase family protein n=1 Tax=Bacillus sp. 165 TaxID=1529117 RepID=UPI001ADA9547|nr:ornithine cyclodeaminase family protein [Bacillus sp. 165]MBO9129362.1 ornithine cyclodeaminase family protein [Bacillus sp. 165]